MVDVAHFASSVGVFVVHFGDPGRTQDALASCFALEHEPGGVFVLDNSGNWPGTESRAVAIRPGRNLGYAGAVNRAVELARECGLTYVWILNNDVTVEPDALGYFAEAFETFPNADIVGSYVSNGTQCYFGGGGFDWKRGRPWHVYAAQSVDKLPIGGFVETDWINGASMVIPVESICRRGSFDDHMFLYKEELEWQIRSPRARAVLVERFLIDHDVGATTGSTMGPLGAAFMARNAMLIARTRRGISRSAWTIEIVWANIMRPLLNGRLHQLRGALVGMRSLDASPEEVIRRVTRPPEHHGKR